MESFNFLGELGLILITLILAIVGIPIVVGLCIASFLGFTGLDFYGIVIIVSGLIWIILYFLLYY